MADKGTNVTPDGHDEHSWSRWCFPTARRLCRAAAVGCDRDLDRVRSRPAAVVPVPGRGDPESTGHPPAGRCPAIVANRQIAEAFPASGSDNMLLVVLTNEKGLGRQTKTLPDTGRPPARGHSRRRDGAGFPRHAAVARGAQQPGWQSLDPAGWPLRRVGCAGVHAAYTRVAETVKHTVAGSTLTAHLTGPAATVADFIAVGLRDQVRIEVAIIISCS